jgi:hypothetical protein
VQLYFAQLDGEFTFAAFTQIVRSLAYTDEEYTQAWLLSSVVAFFGTTLNIFMLATVHCYFCAGENTLLQVTRCPFFSAAVSLFAVENCRFEGLSKIGKIARIDLTRTHFPSFSFFRKRAS